MQNEREVLHGWVGSDDEVGVRPVEADASFFVPKSKCVQTSTPQSTIPSYGGPGPALTGVILGVTVVYCLIAAGLLAWACANVVRALLAVTQ